MESVQKQLEELGLSQNEVKAYLASLELGAATVLQIAAKSAVVRPTAHVAVGSLVKRGLMSSHTRGKKQYFQAERPEVLSLMVEKEKNRIFSNELKLKSLLPRLKALISVAGSKPDFGYYEGLDGLQTMRAVLFGSKATELLVIGSPDRYQEVVGRELTVVHSDNVSRAALSVRQILLHTGKKPSMQVKKGRYRHLRVDELESGEISIFGDYIALITYLDMPYGFLVKSKELARVARLLFELAWKSAR